MKLIVDCGATKADWALQGGLRFRTEGINLAHCPAEKLIPVMDEAAEKIGPGVTEIHFYAAGLVGKSPVDLGRWFPGATVEYASDMVAAARAVCGHGRGIAAIIGTGANTCLWDGEKISVQIRSGGYVIGDEGSASVLGKLFLADYIKGLVPKELASEYGASYEEVVKLVYGSRAPAKSLGGIAPFLLENYSVPYVKGLVDGNFRALFERALCRYGDYPVGVVGGFGYAARDILREIGKDYGIAFSVFMKSPLEGLLEYHGI